MDAQISMRDLEVLRFPDDEEMEGIQGIFYGDYYCWNPIEHTEFIKKIAKPLANLRWGPAQLTKL